MGYAKVRPNGTLRAVVFSIFFCGTIGCANDQPEQKLILHCGAGIRPPAAEIASVFGRRHGVMVECSYGGSEVLLNTIRLSRQGDLYMPGDVHYVDQARDQGLITSQTNVCYFVPVILVQKGNPKNICSLKDLIRPGIRLGLGDPEACAIGRKSAKIFAKNNISQQDIESNVRFRSLTVNELGDKVKLGYLDAAIVWDAVAETFAGDVEKVSIARDQNMISTVAIGVLKVSKHPELAAAFVRFVASEEGKGILERHHYTTQLSVNEVIAP